MSNRTLKIESGPDRMMIAFCLMVGGNREQLPVEFRVAEQDGSHAWSESIKLNGVDREDGSGLSFNITGHNTANGCKVKIYYSLRNRSGTMEFLKS